MSYNVLKALMIGGVYGSGLNELSSSSIRRVVAASGDPDPKKPFRYPTGIDGTVTFHIIKSRRPSEVGTTRTIKFSSFMEWARCVLEDTDNGK